jgi:hypothetical protein
MLVERFAVAGICWRMQLISACKNPEYELTGWACIDDDALLERKKRKNE